MLDDPNNDLTNLMIKYGSHLKTAKEKPIEEHNHVEFSYITRQMLKQLQNDQHPPYSEKNILNTLKQIEASLQKFKELDSNRSSDYEVLLNETKECTSQKKQALEKRSSSSAGVSVSLQQDASPASGDSTQADEGSASDGPVQQQDEFARLRNVEKKCLFCFCLFPLGREVKKREPKHLWVGMGLVADSFKGAEMLEKLVGLGLIECSTGKRYFMKQQVLSMVVKEMNIVFDSDNGLSIMHQNQKQQQPQEQQLAVSQRQQPQQEQPTASQQQQQHQQEPLMSGSLVINKNENTILQSRDFESISKLKNDVKVLHLSSCFDHTKSSYIVVEAEALKALTRHIGQVACLSLQGVSGIVDLPDTIYKFVNLKVLDLRGCPNLEFLPDGIQSLKKLTHLDLSECFLLDHIPKGVASLTELRVLKGLIVNPEDSKMGKGNKKNQRRTSSDASFNQLQDLEKLVKLTIRSRRANFPSGDDFDTLCAMKELANLKIAWVCNYKNDISSVSESGRFPASLKKLELQATPENTLLRLLKLISDDKENSLQKFYIRGGQFWHLGLENYCLPHVHTIRLRYLHELHVDWVQLKEFYPNLTRVEVFDCPNLFFFPCDQNADNGVWNLDIE